MKARIVASVLLAGALALGTAGCGFITPQATQLDYAPSDGISATVGDIDLRNVIGLSADGEDVALVLTLVNSSDSGSLVDFQYTDATGTKVTESVYVGAGNVGAGDATSIGNVGDDQLILSGVDAELGGLFPVYVQYGKAEGKQLLVPVLDGTLPSYSELLPAK